MFSATSIEALGSATCPDCECGGEGTCVAGGCGAVVIMGGGTEAVALAFEVSILIVVDVDCSSERRGLKVEIESRWRSCGSCVAG